jgi:alkylated DNA repair protein (DNA oxidative demethylase)
MSKSGLIYLPQFVKSSEKNEIFQYLSTLYPIWEMRYSKSNPPPQGTNRQLLRPVYWLGNWQFACLDYYHPPKGIYNRCVRAEPFPEVLQNIVQKIESMVRAEFLPKDIPSRWELNTCLINYYGDQLTPDGKKVDVARVGEHKDFEPGPVASISFGERALFQFVKSRGKSFASDVVWQKWLEDSSLQIFGSDYFKKQLFHRVQRVENKGKPYAHLNLLNFEARRINFTFRYVPRDHFVDFHRLPKNLQDDVRPYVDQLAQNSDFFKSAVLTGDSSTSMI